MRKLIPPIAGTLLTVAFEVSIENGWFKGIPDTVVALLWFVPVILWIYWLYTHEEVKSKTHLLSSRPMISFAVFVVGGAALGGSVGALGWWSLKKQHSRQPPPRTSRAADQVSQTEDLLADVGDPAYRQLVAADELGDSKANVRSALNRATRKGNRKVATATDEHYLYVWNV